MTESRIKHIVLLKFKQTRDATEIFFTALANMYEALAKVNPDMEGVFFAKGIYSSPEGANKGFTHMFEAIFPNEAVRNFYLAHQIHDDFLKEYGPLLEDFIAFDTKIPPMAPKAAMRPSADSPPS